VLLGRLAPRLVRRVRAQLVAHLRGGRAHSDARRPLPERAVAPGDAHRVEVVGAGARSRDRHHRAVAVELGSAVPRQRVQAGLDDRPAHAHEQLGLVLGPHELLVGARQRRQRAQHGHRPVHVAQHEHQATHRAVRLDQRSGPNGALPVAAVGGAEPAVDVVRIHPDVGHAPSAERRLDVVGVDEAARLGAEQLLGIPAEQRLHRGLQPDEASGGVDLAHDVEGRVGGLAVPLPRPTGLRSGHSAPPPRRPIPIMRAATPGM
jgi:hypothetical protein